MSNGQTLRLVTREITKEDANRKLIYFEGTFKIMRLSETSVWI